MSVQNYNHHSHNHHMGPVEIKTPHTSYAHVTPKDSILISRAYNAYNIAMIEIKPESYPRLNPDNKHKHQTCTILTPSNGPKLKLDANSQIYVNLQNGEIKAIETSEGSSQLVEGAKLKITKYAYSEGNMDKTYKLITPDGLDSIYSVMSLNEMKELFDPAEYSEHCIKLEERAKNKANLEKCALTIGGMYLALLALLAVGTTKS